MCAVLRRCGENHLVLYFYVDSKVCEDSIWCDFKFIDTKLLISYHFPKKGPCALSAIEDNQAKDHLILLVLVR